MKSIKGEYETIERYALITMIVYAKTAAMERLSTHQFSTSGESLPSSRRYYTNTQKSYNNVNNTSLKAGIQDIL